MLLWRISNYETLDGVGGLLAAGRWHSKGRPVVYCAPDPATALLEVLVHTGEFDVDDMPVTYKYLKTEAPDSIIGETVALADLPAGWQDDVMVTRRIGDRWLAAAHTALLSVPSVVVPETMNVLINPKHLDSAKLHIAEIIAYPLDDRLG